MREHTIKRRTVWFVAAVFAVTWISVSVGTEAQERQAEPLDFVIRPIQTILNAHHAWGHVPQSIKITGTSTRGTTTGPVVITATRQEETLIEYGSKKQVATAKVTFADDGGAKLKFANTPSGFKQLDVTGVFFLKQLTDRTFRVDLPESVTRNNESVTKLHVRGNRQQTHFRLYKVNDEFDLYLNASGQLVEIERTFYADQPKLRYSESYRFSDYRETDNVLLPYRITACVNDEPIEVIDVTAYAIDGFTPSTLFKPRSTR